MLDQALAQTISNTVAAKIVASTKDIKTPEQNWQIIVKIIIEEVFTQIKQNAVVNIDPTTLDNYNSTLSVISPAGVPVPVLGSISSPRSITGKIT